jgi:gluconate 2-dehydrogenase gamma chain
MVTRRRMFTGALGWGAAFLSGYGKKGQSPIERSDSLDGNLSGNNWTALQAAVERILPGANQAGVMEYMRYWLKTRQFSGVRREFRFAADVLDRQARMAHNRVFAACAPEQQDALIKMFAEDSIKEKGFSSRGFFERLVTFTLEGFLSDPKYGGNRDQVGWRFIGYEPCWWAPRPK